MRKTRLVLLSASVALLCTLLSIHMRTSIVAAKPETPATSTESSVYFDPTPQNAHFIWVSAEGDQSRPGFHRVIGGKHRDGTEMYICRVSGFVPGKIYRNSCHYSAAGQENVININYEVLLTDTGYDWRSFDELTRSEIRKGAVLSGVDPNNNDKQFMCRRHMSDGWHPGKYSYKNNLCYIPWGNVEKFYAKDFEILFPTQ